MLSLTEKLFLRLFLRFKTLENGEKMKQKYKNKYPKMQFSKETQQNDRQEMDIEHGFS